MSLIMPLSCSNIPTVNGIKSKLLCLTRSPSLNWDPTHLCFFFVLERLDKQNYFCSLTYLHAFACTVPLFPISIPLRCLHIPKSRPAFEAQLKSPLLQEGFHFPWAISSLSYYLCTGISSPLQDQLLKERNWINSSFDPPKNQASQIAGINTYYHQREKTALKPYF